MAQEIIKDLGDIVLKSPADIYIYTGAIDRNIQTLRDLICQHANKNKEVDLFLATYGGDPDWAYRLVTTLRKYYSKINVVIAGSCKSAGTLIALGADTLRFHEYGELGPLDVQIRRKDNLLGYNSGLDVFQALTVINNSAGECFHKIFLGFILKGGGSISTEVAAKIAKDLSVGIYSSIASKIDPLELGEKNRAMGIAAKYGNQLCSLSKCPNAKEDTVTKLISDYPSHGFVIDIEQAKNLFHNVEEMTTNDYKIYYALKDILTNPDSLVIWDLKNMITTSLNSKKELQNEDKSTTLPEKEINTKNVNSAKRKNKSA